MVLSYEEKVLNAAVSKLGLPYIWCAKGPDSFDCSGLVTWALLQAGGPDLRATHNSQKLWDEGAQGSAEVMLEFYGADAYHVSHVTFSFNGWTIECAGGDSTTVAPKPGACVMFHKGRYEGPGHWFLGQRLLPR